MAPARARGASCRRMRRSRSGPPRTAATASIWPRPSSREPGVTILRAIGRQCRGGDTEAWFVQGAGHGWPGSDVGYPRVPCRPADVRDRRDVRRGRVPAPSGHRIAAAADRQPIGWGRCAYASRELIRSGRCRLLGSHLPFPGDTIGPPLARYGLWYPLPRAIRREDGRDIESGPQFQVRPSRQDMPLRRATKVP